MQYLHYYARLLFSGFASSFSITVSFIFFSLHSSSFSYLLFLFFYLLLQWFHVLVFFILSEHTCTPAQRFSPSSFSSFFYPLLYLSLLAFVSPSNPAHLLVLLSVIKNCRILRLMSINSLSLQSGESFCRLSVIRSLMMHNLPYGFWKLKRRREEGKSGALVSSERTGFYKTY